MSSEVAALEADIKSYVEQLDTVAEALLADDSNVELQALKKELEDAIKVIQEAIQDLKPAANTEANAATAPSLATIEEKWSKDKHPAFQPGYKRHGAPASPAEEVAPASASVVLKVNDMVLAKWVTGDKAFYPARITAITGSSADPIYNVTFKSYGNSETLRGNDIKPVANDQRKRKADESPAADVDPSSPASMPSNPGIISAPANINPDLAAKKEPSKVSDGPTRPAKVPRKVKATKELEAGKSKWQDFTTKGKFGKTANAKVMKKDSMFRTGEGVNARVGFTGSGHEMTKDKTRSRHVYDKVAERE